MVGVSSLGPVADNPLKKGTGASRRPVFVRTLVHLLGASPLFHPPYQSRREKAPSHQYRDKPSDKLSRLIRIRCVGERELSARAATGGEIPVDCGDASECNECVAPPMAQIHRTATWKTRRELANSFGSPRG